jgi:fatty acid desaturase
MNESSVRVSGGDYAELKRILRAEGLFTAQLRFYVLKSSMTIGALAGVVAVALWPPHPAVLALSAIGFGLLLTQIGMLGHDVAHRQVIRRGRWVAVSGWVLGNLLMGVSYSWWTQKHNRHHANPNHLTKDPDASYPMFVHSSAQIPYRSSYLRPVIALQAFLYPLFGSFLFISMRAASFGHVFRRSAKAAAIQGLGLVAHLALFGLLLTQLGGWGTAITFLALSQLTFGLYNVAVFAPNHKGMTMVADDEPQDFLRNQVLTARNVRGSRFVDFWYGGLNYQIEHHLFPTMPRNRLKEAQPIVRGFCEQHGIPYHQTTMAGSYREIFGHLHRASAPIREGTA